MSFSLKPYQLIAFWIPGFVVLAIISFADLKSGHNHLNISLMKLAFLLLRLRLRLPHLQSALFSIAFATFSKI
jgi:hypothetical protein